MSYSFLPKVALIYLSHNSKKLQFSILSNQDAVKISEFEVTHRDLYTPTDRLPVKNGVLDRRLVRIMSYIHQLT